MRTIDPFDMGLGESVFSVLKPAKKRKTPTARTKKRNKRIQARQTFVVIYEVSGGVQLRKEFRSFENASRFARNISTNPNVTRVSSVRAT